MAGNHGTNHKRVELGGYMTVEAAMIVPAVFILVVMLLYLMFYMYDRCIMTQDLYTAAYRRSIERGRSKAGASQGGASQQTGDTQVDTSRYFMLSSCSCSVQGGSRVKGSGEASMNVPGAAAFPGVQERWGFRVLMAARKTDPPLAFRKYRRVMALARQALAGTKQTP